MPPITTIAKIRPQHATSHHPTARSLTRDLVAGFETESAIATRGSWRDPRAGSNLSGGVLTPRDRARAKT